jgi:signal transduction histidine kinase
MTQQKTILYIEDDPASRVLVQRVLSHAGYKVLIAHRALEGIDLAKRHRPDLILTDINLPDLSGREITVRLRSDPRLASVPIVALTAQSHDMERNKTFVAGVNGYITKPVDVATLTDRLEEYLQGQHDTIDAIHWESAQRAYHRELVERLEANVRELEATNRDLRRLDQLKDDFIQLTAHELRTPLTTVHGYSRLVQTSETIQRVMASDPDVAACLRGLMDSIERLHSVVNEIITISRVASGRVDLKPGPTNLGELVQRVILDYAQVIEQRRIILNLDSPQWPPLFYSDAALIELSLSNLLGNAIKYTPDGGTVTINVQIKEPERTVRISIKDSGIGISLEDQQYIFDRFYTAGDTQLHSTSKTAYRGGGLGLGLAICRGIVEAHGGDIWVESEGCDPKTHPGSTFFIDLPLDVHAPLLKPEPGMPGSDSSR